MVSPSPCQSQGGSAWQSLQCWLGQGWAEIAAAEAFGVAVWTVTAQGFHTERDRNETAPCSQRKEGIMGRLFLFAEPNEDCVTPKASLYTHTHTHTHTHTQTQNLSLCFSFLSLFHSLCFPPLAKKSLLLFPVNQQAFYLHCTNFWK